MVKILFGSQTGNAQNLAHIISDEFSNVQITNEVLDFSHIDPEEIKKIRFLIIVTSTYGDGEPPDNASDWMSYIKFNDDLNLSHLKFAVLGLGDRYYPHFCQCAKDFDHYLSKRGADALQERLDCDQYFEDQYQEWLSNLINVLKNKLQE